MQNQRHSNSSTYSIVKRANYKTVDMTPQTANKINYYFSYEFLNYENFICAYVHVGQEEAKLIG